MSESEPNSLEFIEDPYLPGIDDLTTFTPSLDPDTTISDEEDTIDWYGVAPEDSEAELYLRNLTLDQIFYDVDSDYTNSLELQAVEASEFMGAKLANQAPSASMSKRFRLKFFAKRTMRDLKVTFIDFSKPYLAKISNSDNYKRFLNIAQRSRGTLEGVVA